MTGNVSSISSRPTEPSRNISLNKIFDVINGQQTRFSARAVNTASAAQVQSHLIGRIDSREDCAGRLNLALVDNILKSQTRKVLDMVDGDNPDPKT